MIAQCLFINAFTPSAAEREAGSSVFALFRVCFSCVFVTFVTFSDAALLPVAVYIHGGGFVGGSAPTAWNYTRATVNFTSNPAFLMLP